MLKRILVNGRAGYVNEEGIRYNAVEYTANQERPATLENQMMGVCPSIVLNLEQTDMWCTEEEMQNGFVIDRKENNAYVECDKLGNHIYYYIDGKMLVVYGFGNMYDATILSDLRFHLKSDIEEIIIKEGIVAEGIQNIGNYMFANLVNLKKVVIPEGVIAIGDYLFSGCQNLKEVTLPSTLTHMGVNPFEDCKKLTITDMTKKPVTSDAVGIGDLNRDAQISLIDAQIVLKAALKITELNETELGVADVDYDSKVTLNDAKIILRAA